MDQYYIESGYFTPENYFAYIAAAQSEPFSNFTVTAVGDILGGNSATLNAVTDTVTVNTRRRLAASQFDVLTTKVTVAAKTSAVSADCLSTISMTATGSRVAGGTSTLNTVASLSAVFSTSIFADADLTSTATVSVSGTKVKFNSATANSSFTVTANNQTLKYFSSSLATSADTAVTALKQRGGQAVLASAIAVNTETSVLKGMILDLSTNVGTIFNASKVVSPNAFLLANGGTLIVADIINIDEYLMFTVPQETRQYVVTEETRHYTIEQETRTYKL